VVVVDRDRGGALVAAFGDPGLGLAFARAEVARGRRLDVVEPRSGQVLLEGPAEAPGVEPPRTSLTRLRAPVDGDEG